MKNVLYAIAATVITGQAFAETPPPPPETPVDVEYGQVCAPISVTVYFSGETAEISPHARAALESTIDSIGSCAVTAIQTTAVAHDAATDNDLLQISEERAENVLAAIASAGIWANSVQTDIVFARSTNRPDTATEPVARRVEVEMHTVRPISS